MTGIDDVQALVERAQTGDREAFGELYDRLAPEIFRYALREEHGHLEEAQDVTSEVFLRALRHLGGYQYRGLPYLAWLYRIARNLLLDCRRSRTRRFIRPIDELPEAPDVEAEQALTRRLDREELVVVLDHLNDNQRQAVSLRFLDGLSIAETARRVGRTETSVKKAQARGLARMRRIIEESRQVEDESLAARAVLAPDRESRAYLGAA